MKSQLKFILTIISFIAISSLCAQSYQSGTLVYQGVSRQYQIYVPASYTGSTPVPLIFNFHGGNGSIASQIAISDLSTLAEANQFIAVYPLALPDPNDGGSTNWLHKPPTAVDDVFFIDALIDDISLSYQIDQNRIYACGYSLGGEFTYELACRLNQRIAAVGVVARTLQVGTFNNCAPVHPTGVLTILGTNDNISPYGGVVWNGVQYYLSADDTHDYWITHNNCNMTPNVSTIPNTNTSDGSTVERYEWSDPNGCAYVEHLKVIGGGHDWPGSFGNMDINSNNEIWNFVSKYDLNGYIGCQSTSAADAVLDPNCITLLPNPTTGLYQIQGNLSSYNIRILDINGNVYQTLSNTGASLQIDITNLPTGMYFVEMSHITTAQVYVKKILKM